MFDFISFHTVTQRAGVECSVHSSVLLSAARQRALWMYSR